jgi:methyl-accepting chemotaxis protein
MKLTIRNKLVWGFCGVLTLLAIVAAIGMYSVYRLRHSAQDAMRIGGRLNAIALEIQEHNLEAQLRVKNYLLEVKALGPQKARELYLDEAEFEVAAIESAAAKAVSIAPTPQKREKFQKILDQAVFYKSALKVAVQVAEADTGPEVMAATNAAYEKVAVQFHDAAEDGEVAGREASQASFDDIELTSKRAVTMTIGVSLIGMLLGITMSYTLCRAILVPVEHLKDVAENVSLGNLEIAVRRYSSDEIGDLADSFSRMVTAVKFFRAESEDALAAGITEERR